MVGPSSQISKILLTLLFLLIIFFIFMDVELYLRIQNYPIERNFHYKNATAEALRSQSHAQSAAASSNYNGIGVVVGVGVDDDLSTLGPGPLPTFTATAHSHAATFSALVAAADEDSYAAHTWVSCDINPLCHITVKAVLLDHTNLYIFAPLVTIFDNIVDISHSTFITANMISFFHVGVACVAGKLVSSDSLGYRRLGVLLFEIRTFLDDLDGHVARVKKNIRGERSEVGTAGYYIDGICDGLGCIALLIGIFFFLKNNPPRRGYSQLPTSESKLPEPILRPKMKPSTRKVAKKVVSFTGQLLLSSTAWNRYIALYQEMLERNDVSPAEFQRQNAIFKSFWFFCVAWLWRVVNVHSLLHCVLLSIFCDKLWDFLKAIQYSGYALLLVAICAAEMHIIEAHNFISNSLSGNNTSL